MKVLILAAGYGTRLYELVKDTPKALLDINGKPLANYILDRITNLNGLTEVVVVTNNKFYSIFKDWANGFKDCSHQISVVNDCTDTPEQRLGSIGDIDYVLQNHAIDEDLLVVGGDNLFDYNVDEYIEFAKSNTSAVTIGLYDIKDIKGATKFGVVSIDKKGKITSFEEKPKEPKSTLIGMCFYYLPKNTLNLINEYLEEVKKSDTAGDYIRWLLEKKEVYGFKFDGLWYDIGSVESYREAQKRFK